MRKNISAIAALSCLLAGGIASAQMTQSDIDYSELLAEHERQQEEMWRPLLEVVLEEVEAEAELASPTLTAADKHASRGALFLEDEDGKGGLLLLPRNDAYEMAIQSRGCNGNLPSSDNMENQAAAFVGESASFALRGAPSTCEGAGFAFNSAGEQDQQDVGIYLSPALAECADGACTLRGVKGEIRVGEIQNAEDGKGGWYMYAAADGTRVVWDERPSGLLDLQNSIDVSDSLTMGDIEAGIMLSRGTADLSLNYVHRRAKFATWEEKVVDNEDYVGIKLTFD